MSMRDRNRSNGEAYCCGSCCDSVLSNGKRVKQKRRQQRRREAQAWRRDAE